jgi:hypothetical protein
MAGLIAFIGCGNGLTSDFSKSSRYAFALIKSAEEHKTVLEADVTKALAQAEADAKSDADKKTFDLLKYYLSAFQTNDGTPAGKKYVTACHNSLSQVFDENADPDKAAEQCTKALQAKVDQIMKETETEQGKSGAGSKK